jgi:hypothetical protein
MQAEFLPCQYSVTTIDNHPQGIPVNHGLDLRRIGIGRIAPLGAGVLCGILTVNLTPDIESAIHHDPAF